ncbi:MAG: hypothetical protein ACYC1E_00515 [Propionibacteriaceae bacterium]
MQDDLLLSRRRLQGVVRGAAGERQGGPGYAWEIHTMAFPGKSSPSLPSL